jgi:hypothetical protein
MSNARPLHLPQKATAQYAMGGAPRPNAAFREFTFRYDRAEIPVMDPGATHELAARIAKNPRVGSPAKLDLGNIEGATHCEVVFEYWGGHLGTSDMGVVVNDQAWYELPQTQGTPTNPLAYYRIMQGGATVDLDLGDLRSGVNEFLFTAGPQVVHNFNLGFYWMYSFTVRLYFADLSHPVVNFCWPLSGDTLGEMGNVAVKCESDFTRIKQVDFVGRYLDYPWSGNGIANTWQLRSHWGAWGGHIGSTDHTVTDEPLSVTWDTQWIPDQPTPIALMARVQTLDGVMSTTPVLENVTFARAHRSVQMVPSHNVPEAFGVRVGERKTCGFRVEKLDGLVGARLAISSWSAAHADEIGFNGQLLVDKLGRVHDTSFDLLPIPRKWIREGENEFFMFAETEHHMAEMNWPGPVLLLEYEV